VSEEEDVDVEGEFSICGSGGVASVFIVRQWVVLVHAASIPCDAFLDASAVVFQRVAERI
jgi:hypothetical protein